ncbi:hypothetical protein K7X08_000804 [Anisodus acutangulus]|uniref:Uncharacterized protein n=1 Tax=Anisodus acutangulus TaxID=402998 RepID=A0A9Q1RKT8_9SOLA|nr:hypothetical protein K7X08_000804 [Anisodus acutangulus]
MPRKKRILSILICFRRKVIVIVEMLLVEPWPELRVYKLSCNLEVSSKKLLFKCYKIEGIWADYVESLNKQQRNR